VKWLVGREERREESSGRGGESGRADVRWLFIFFAFSFFKGSDI